MNLAALLLIGTLPVLAMDDNSVADTLNEINYCQVSSAMMLRVLTISSTVVQAAAPIGDPNERKRIATILAEHAKPAAEVIELGGQIEKRIIENADRSGLDSAKLAQASAKSFRAMDDKMVAQVFGEAVLDGPAFIGKIATIDKLVTDCNQMFKRLTTSEEPT